MLLITNFLKPNDLRIIFVILFIYDFLGFANTKKESFLMKSLNLSFHIAKSLSSSSLFT